MQQDTLQHITLPEQPDTSQLSGTTETAEQIVQTDSNAQIVSPEWAGRMQQPDSLMLDSLTLDSLMRDSLYQDSLLKVQAAQADTIAEQTLPTGMAGERPPFSLNRNDAVTGAALICILLSMFIIAEMRHHLGTRLSAFFFPRDNYNEENASSQEHPLVLPTALLVFCMECSILFLGFVSSIHFHPAISQVAHILLGAYMVMTFGYCMLKYLLYAMVNSVFFTRSNRHTWWMHYSLLFIIETIALLPLTVIYIYAGFDSAATYYCIAALLLLVKILLLIKEFVVFFRKSDGILHLIVYFCALEIVPAIIWCISLGWFTQFMTSV